MLKKRFETLCQKYTEDEKLIKELWEEIEQKYSTPNRHYHTIEHLEHIYKELDEILLNPILEFAIFYHDFIYDVRRVDNEEESAKIAKNRLDRLKVSIDTKEKVSQLILETKTHKATSQQNVLFLDADLTILGAEPIIYRDYNRKIREEYILYPDDIYIKGRKRVIEMFLKRDRIYQTEYFYNLYEKNARCNLKNSE